ncbi:hypothetical protein STEG23_035844 [Scotinomys teguina]
MQQELFASTLTPGNINVEACVCDGRNLCRRWAVVGRKHWSWNLMMRGPSMDNCDTYVQRLVKHEWFEARSPCQSHFFMDIQVKCLRDPEVSDYLLDAQTEWKGERRKIERSIWSHLILLPGLRSCEEADSSSCSHSRVLLFRRAFLTLLRRLFYNSISEQGSRYDDIPDSVFAPLYH